MKRPLLAFLLLICLGLGAVGYRYYPIDGQVQWKYAITTHVNADKPNGYFAYIGLAAPAGTTPYDYGTAYVEKFRKWRQENPLNAKIWRALLGLYDKNAPALENPPAVGGDVFVESIKQDELQCWLMPKEEYKRRSAQAVNCVTGEALDAAIATNARLLENFATLLSYTRYDAIEETIFMKTGAPLWSLAHLYAASLVRQAQVGDVEQAMNSAVKALQAQKNFRNGNTDVVTRSVMTSIPFASVMRAILFENPQFARAFTDKVSAALIDDKDEQVAAALNGENTTLIVPLEKTGGLFFSFRPNATKAQIAQCAHALVDAVPDNPFLPTQPVECGPQPPGILNDIGDNAAATVNVGLTAIWSSSRIVAARLRAQALFTQALAARVPPAGMAKFLVDSPVLNPLTQKHFLWDSARNGIYYGESDRPDADPTRDIIYPTF